jgi:hypothetical protein
MKFIQILKEEIQYKAQFSSNERRHIESFIKFILSELGINEEIDIILQNDKNGIKTTAVYNYGGGQPSTIKVYCRERLLVDVLRSIAHEMVHHMQFENGKLEDKPQNVGGPIEDEANAKAGELVKKYAKNGNEDIYPSEFNVGDLNESMQYNGNTYEPLTPTYDSETKSMICAYMVSYRDDRSFVATNLKEYVKYERTSNGPYVKFELVPLELPMNVVKIVGVDSECRHFVYFSIPYSYYKKHKEDLEYKRIKADVKTAVIKGTQNIHGISDLFTLNLMPHHQQCLEYLGGYDGYYRYLNGKHEEEHEKYLENEPNEKEKEWNDEYQTMIDKYEDRFQSGGKNRTYRFKRKDINKGPDRYHDYVNNIRPKLDQFKDEYDEEGNYIG